MSAPGKPDAFRLWPDGFEAMLGLEAAVGKAGLDHRLVELIKVRCSELNRCSYCTQLHYTEAIRIGIDETTLGELARWEDSTQFSAAERTALALAEALTKPGTGDLNRAVTDARTHFTETEIAQLGYTIATINAWNRLATLTISD